MRECVFPNDGVTLTLPDHWISDAMVLRPDAEPIFRRLVAHLLKQAFFSGNIIDAGAWIGDNALPWAKMIPGTVYAIDPCLNNLAYIDNTAKENQLNNVRTICAGLSDKCGWLYTNDAMYHCQLGESGSTPVMCWALDELLEEKDIRDIGFIHLDVEGMEAKVLRGASWLISCFEPLIAFEQHIDTDDYRGLCKWLSGMGDYGYDSFLINEQFAGCRPDCRNFIAAPRAHRIEELLTAYPITKIE
jgi:FkbM family methyltransferase